ncbi:MULTISPECIES: succinyl-diaminopimelate desuccinylase [Arthrobacter]|uniref:Succinyl-diaminopimelate desuccinylase n=2 Tax=Arthrobacter TaxID=1663 RepID=A0ABU9KKX2_9MICC|nr:succinyl-diaminopimelate desuccinylase [Arthrobacter sp. YJM1]MDP5227127.1 succinyl-diaminopimelate desuccinylase [Arthrobacter sp. YJM1]
MTALDLHQDVSLLTAALIDINSVSDAETPIADAVEAALRELDGFEITRDGDSIVARTTAGHGERVILAGHLDTVPLPTTEGSRGTVPSSWDGAPGEGVLHGRGAVDMKGGVAVQLALAAAIGRGELTPARDVTFVFYDHEEVEATKSGLGRLVRNHPALLEGEFAILLEPTNGVVEGGCNGTSRFEVTTHGVAAHSARAWMGENAIHAVAPVLARLAAYQPKTVSVDGLDYRESLNAVLINGGTAGNVIPDRCVVEINYRFAPDKTPDDAERHVRELMDGFEVVRTDAASGARPGLTHPAAASFVAAVGGEPKPKYGWTDVARFSELGVPAVNFGPGDALLAHKDDERVDADAVRACLAALTAWLSPIA